MSNVKIVKLRTGEELIATVTGDSTTINLKKPCILIPTGENQLGLAPWGFVCKESSNDEGISIPTAEVLFIGTPVDDLWNKYNSVFGSKLVVPDKSVASANYAGLKLAE